MIDQIGIAATGVTAIYLSQDHRENWRKWACIFGLLGQPFWLYATFTAGQYGIFGLCFLYTLAWARGLKAHWFKS
jgi:hypothetical protein